MMDSLGIQNGSFFLQGFIVGDDIVFFEMGLRLSGGAGYLQIERQNQINQVEMHLRYALTGKFDGWDVQSYDNPRFHFPACVLVVLLRDGRIKAIEGLESIKKHENVFNIVQFKQKGDKLNARGTLNQVFARIYMTGKNGEDLRETITFVKQSLKITDMEDRNMILNLFAESTVK